MDADNDSNEGHYCTYATVEIVLVSHKPKRRIREAPPPTIEPKWGAEGAAVTGDGVVARAKDTDDKKTKLTTTAARAAETACYYEETTTCRFVHSRSS